ncbi:hypothetical protein LXL04_027696 [Taraxacum kok-saghyz]
MFKVGWERTTYDMNFFSEALITDNAASFFTSNEWDIGPYIQPHLQPQNMMIGGTDTSVVTIEWAMTELMKNPDVMQKAQAEVRRVFKGKKTILERNVESNVKLVVTVYDIPEKMKVVVNGLACVTDPEYWDDPQSFKPERFEKTSYDFFGTSPEYIPFGSGRRICPGIAFGLVSIELTLARLLFHFNWELPNGLKPKDIDMTEGHGVTAIKKSSLEVIPTVFIPF